MDSSNQKRLASARNAMQQIDTVLNVFNKDINSHPEKFVQEDPALEKKLTQITKTLFDLAKQNELPRMKNLTGPLKSLIVDGFDSEQIWEELNMQNEPLLDFIEANMDALQENDDDLELDLGNLLPEMDSEDEEMDDEMDGIENSDEDEDADMDGMDGMDDEDEDEDLPDLEPIGSKNSTKKENKSTKKSEKKGSAVDDEFFKLSDLEKFLDDADEQGDNFFDGEDDDEDKDEDDEDDDEMARDLMYGERDGFADFEGDMDEDDKKLEAFFKKTKKMMKDDDDEDKDEEEEQEEENFDPSKAKFKDFFAAAKTGDEEEEDDMEGDVDGDDEFAFLSNYEKERKDMNDKIKQLESEVMEEDDGDDDGPMTEEQRKSRHEIRQKRLEEKIRKFEEENIEGRGWQLRGEIQANKRPVNSLLEEPIEFQHGTKVTPTITQEVSIKLEDLIRQRIIEGAFDDVIKRIERPKKGDHRETAAELDGTKSKKGLGELYEEDYMKQTAGVVEETEMTKEHQEVSKLFRKLCFKLDALSHAQFAPRKVRDEIEIRKVKDVGAIQMEEILPVAVSDAQRLAPEEIYEKDKLTLKSEAELDSEDKKRLRRRRKHHHKVREENKENEIKRKEKLSGTKAQATMKDTMKTIKDGKNTVVATQGDRTNYAQSAQMFSKLQKEASQDMQALKKQKMEMYNQDTEKKKKAASQSKSLKLM